MGCDCTLSTTGAWEAIVNCRVVGEAGVTLTPPVVVKLGVRVTVSATVPVCNRIAILDRQNSALVLLAGMVKSTVRLPVSELHGGICS